MREVSANNPPAAPSASAAPAASAAPVVDSTPHLTHLLPADVPDRCKALAKDADAKQMNRALSARIALASCLADLKTKPLVLCDCEQSVNEVNEATKLSVTLLDEVYAMGDASMKILARQAKGDLIANMSTRMLATIPPAASEQQAALRNTRVDLLMPILEPWRQEVVAAYGDVDKLAKANPQLAKNQAIVAAVKTSRTRLAAANAQAPATAPNTATATAPASATATAAAPATATAAAPAAGTATGTATASAPAAPSPPAKQPTTSTATR